MASIPAALKLLLQFQTPSERGGIPLSRRPRLFGLTGRRFKPLQSGAGFLWRPLRACRHMASASFKPLQSGAGFLCWHLYLVKDGIVTGFKPLQSGAGFLCTCYDPTKNPDGSCFKPLQSGAGFLWAGRPELSIFDSAGFKPLQSGAGFLCIYLTTFRPMGRSSFKPLQSGAGFLWTFTPVALTVIGKFQTPSERGGIPLNDPIWSNLRYAGCFKPLQSGAGFLWMGFTHSFRRTTCVSNPFRAGRDSSAALHNLSAVAFGLFQTPSERGGIPLWKRTILEKSSSAHCFKPLQSGAGFLWLYPNENEASMRFVSNPFRAGRDSSGTDRDRGEWPDGRFQTPSERGGIPLVKLTLDGSIGCGSFKPLQSGAGFL